MTQLVKCNKAEECLTECEAGHKQPHQKEIWCDTSNCSSMPFEKIECLPVPQTALDRIREELQYIKDNPDAANIEGIARTIIKLVGDEALDRITELLHKLRPLQEALEREIVYRTQYVGGQGDVTTLLHNGEEIGQGEGLNFCCNRCPERFTGVVELLAHYRKKHEAGEK